MPWQTLSRKHPSWTVDRRLSVTAHALLFSNTGAMTNPDETTAERGHATAPDAFLSHSSRDKSLFARPLVECLAEHGANIWYDEYSLQPGDSLSASIDEGLSTAQCGLLVISPAFIQTARESGWTRYELRGIVSNSIGMDGRQILPIWLDVDMETVREFSPPLADLVAIVASGKAIEQVALEVLEVIAPHRAGGLRRFRFLAAAKGGTATRIPLRDLHESPAQDRRVGGHVLLRVLLVTQILADCGDAYARDYQKFLEDLTRDIHHEKELRTWEAIASTYSVGCSSFALNSEQKNALYRLLLATSVGLADEAATDKLSPGVAAALLDHFAACMELAHGEAVIGPGGLRGLISEDAAPTRNGEFNEGV